MASDLSPSPESRLFPNFQIFLVNLLSARLLTKKRSQIFAVPSLDQQAKFCQRVNTYGRHLVTPIYPWTSAVQAKQMFAGGIKHPSGSSQSLAK